MSWFHPASAFTHDGYQKFTNTTNATMGKYGKTYERKTKAKGSEFVVGNAPYTRRASAARATPYKRKGKGKKGKVSPIKKLKAQVDRLAVGVKAATGNLTHRYKHFHHSSSGVGLSNTTQVILCDKAQLQTCLNFMPYYDSGTNSVIEVDSNNKAFASGIEVKSTSITVKITNNLQVSTHIRVALMSPTGDTGLGPVACFESGLLVQGKPASAANTGKDNPLVRWSDSQQLVDMWKNIPGTYKDVILSPGAIYEAKAQLPCYNYEQRTTANDGLQYRVADRACVLMIQQRGNVRQDFSTPGQMNFGANTIQVEALVVRKFEYAAGADIRCSQYHSTEGSLLGTLLQCNQPNTETRSI